MTAERCRIRYEGRKVNSDIRNLGYTRNDVVCCILGLRDEHFDKSLQYENASYDAYIRDFQRSEDGPIDRIYMKLRLLDTDELQVGIGSFHL